MSNLQRGDILTIEIEDADAVVSILIERGIPFSYYRFEHHDELLIPAEHAKKFSQVVCDIINKPGCLDDYDSFQGEFLTAVYDDQRETFVDFSDPIGFIPTIEDLDSNVKPDIIYDAMIGTSGRRRMYWSISGKPGGPTFRSPVNNNHEIIGPEKLVPENWLDDPDCEYKPE